MMTMKEYVKLIKIFGIIFGIMAVIGMFMPKDQNYYSPRDGFGMGSRAASFWKYRSEEQLYQETVQGLKAEKDFKGFTDSQWREFRKRWKEGYDYELDKIYKRLGLR